MGLGMNEIIDRVAAAIGALPPSALAADRAKAAILAMREPTDDMVEAAHGVAWPASVKECWYAMIDKAGGQ